MSRGDPVEFVRQLVAGVFQRCGNRVQLEDGNGNLIVIPGGLTVVQPDPNLLNANANIQVGDVDVADANPVPVSDAAGSLTVDQANPNLLNANANLQVGDVDVGPANPVPVQAVAGENHIGQVGSPGITISQTPTVTAGAYVANDAVGGLLTFADAARVAGGGGVIKDMILLDDAGQDAEMELWLFSVTFTAMVDNAPWAPSEPDLRNLVAIITTSDGAWFAAGTPSAARAEVSQRYDLAGTSLFGQLVTRGTPTFAATDDVTVSIGLLQD